MSRRGDIAMSNGDKGNNKKSHTNANNNPSQLPESKRNRSNRIFQRLDLRVVAVIVLVIASFAVAFYYNEQKQSDNISSFANGLDIDNGDLKINWSRYQTTDIQLSEPIIITQSGTYYITGFLYNGGITIDAGIGEVKIILDNTIIDNPTGPAIYCKNAEDLVIELVGNNSLTDGESYAEGYDEDVTGVIYSKADLAFQGDGSITVNTNYQDAIVGKDDIVFRSGTYTLNSKDDAIRGKDSVYVTSGTFMLNATSDAIKTTNELDQGKGFIYIENGNFTISSTEGKGLEATNTIIIHDGSLTINSFDDAIHSNNYIGIAGGSTSITSNDDGIHADNKISIEGGDISIIKSYEGIEARIITINNGDISIMSSDDGLNAGGGNDGSAIGYDRQGLSKTDANCTITINGGKTYINASGDGVDSNGSVNFNGGTTIVDGPTNNGNGALDSGTNITMSGGTVIAIGASGMANSLGSHSSTYNINVFLDTIKPAGTKISIQDSAGNSVITHTSAKSFSHIAVGADSFKLGDTYSISLNDEKYQTFTISDITTNIGRRNNNHLSIPDADSRSIDDDFNQLEGESPTQSSEQPYESSEPHDLPDHQIYRQAPNHPIEYEPAY